MPFRSTTVTLTFAGAGHLHRAFAFQSESIPPRDPLIPRDECAAHWRPCHLTSCTRNLPATYLCTLKPLRPSTYNSASVAPALPATHKYGHPATTYGSSCVWGETAAAVCTWKPLWSTWRGQYLILRRQPGAMMSVASSP